VWENEQVEWWYAQNAFLYVETEYLKHHPSLWREFQFSGGAALPLVHPKRFLEWVEWGKSLCGATVEATNPIGEAP
jgi:hypothetical protein